MTLPKLQDRPSFEKLCEALEGLAIKPASWSTDCIENPSLEDFRDVNDYLLSIITSSLRWIKVTPDDDESATDPKEVLWDLASKRMAERCGRSGKRLSFFLLCRSAPLIWNVFQSFFPHSSLFPNILLLGFHSDKRLFSLLTQLFSDARDDENLGHPSLQPSSRVET